MFGTQDLVQRARKVDHEPMISPRTLSNRRAVDLYGLVEARGRVERGAQPDLWVRCVVIAWVAASKEFGWFKNNSIQSSVE